MRLHLPGVPHTVTDEAHSHCAFTGKVLKFPAMIARAGYEVVHYGVEGAKTQAAEQVSLMTQAEQNTLRGHDGSDPTRFVGDDGDIGTKLYKEFNARLRLELIRRVEPGDIVLLPFGHAHGEAVVGLNFTTVESGIGYPVLYEPASFRVFESYAWMHLHQGKANREGRNYEWVIPNYFDADAWTVETNPDLNTVVFLGRICDMKGLPTVVEVAKRRPDLRFVICGQGDPEPYLVADNIEYRAPISGDERSPYLGNARAVLMPTAFTEPFGGVAVEAMLCGTPVISTSYGAFTETIVDGETGFRCHTLGDFLAGLDLAKNLDREAIAKRARDLYSYGPIAEKYDRAFLQIADLKGDGWFTLRSTFGPVVGMTPVTKVDPWVAAQRGERKFHMKLECRPYEERKRKQYAALMDIQKEEIDGLKVIDFGAGPESLLLSYAVLPGSVAIDPLTFTDEDEARYAEAGIERFREPGENFVTADLFDEAWCYNCLQHVKDPVLVLAHMKASAKRVRIFEWCEVPTDDLHLHSLTADLFRKAFEGWKVVNELEGIWRQYDCRPDKYFVAIYERPRNGSVRP